MPSPVQLRWESVPLSRKREILDGADLVATLAPRLAAELVELGKPGPFFKKRSQALMASSSLPRRVTARTRKTSDI